MKRTIYRDYVVDTDNLGRQYIYNAKSPYSEDSDRLVIGVDIGLPQIKRIIDYKIETGILDVNC